jgi:hypothetical protein
MEMANPVGVFMARIGGADKDILELAPHDRMRFIQMAGVLFTTSGIAVLSMSFALHNGVKAPLVPSIVLGILWGLVIFNLDRFLVLSMGDTRTRGWRLVGLMLPRFALAALLALVVSTPLVLRIFERDINQQLSVMHQEQSKQFASLVAHNADQQEANKIENQIKAYQATLNGHPPQRLTSPQLADAQSRVQKLQATAKSDFATANHKYEAWQCELDGQTCAGGSGQAGNGARAHAKQVAYDSAEAAYQSAENQLQSAESAENGDQHAFTKFQSQRLAQLKQTANQKLPGLEAEYNKLENKVQTAIANGDQANEQDTGILAQLQALSEASAHNSSLAAARWTVLALFFVIEILPVTVKALLNLGRPTAYEQVAIEKEGEIIDREQVRRVEKRRIEEEESQARVRDAQGRIRRDELESETKVKIEEGKQQTRTKVEEDMRLREEDIGKSANEYVASEMTKVLDSALKEWGDRIRDRLSSDVGPASNGHAPASETHTNPGYDLPDEGML